MSMELAVVEPIQSPDARTPAKLTSLPQWVAERCGRLKLEEQPDPITRNSRKVPTLPAEMIPNQTQRGLILKHAAELDRLLLMTPAQDYRLAEKTAVAVGKMMLVLPSKEAGEMAAEAKSEAYMAALDDVPFWAVQEAMRRWYRGEYGSSHDYKWQPGPAALRELATIETWRVKAVRRQMAQLLNAEPLIEFDEAHRARMVEKIKALGIGLLVAPKRDSERKP